MATTKKIKTETVVETKLEDLMVEFKTKSAVIRHLNSLGKTNGEIAKFMGIRYQHVRNVLVTPLKKAPVAVESTTSE